jgi:hypothetical protein
MNGQGPLDFEATIDAKTFNSILDEMERRLRGVGDRAIHEGSRIDDAFRNASVAIGSYFSLRFAGQFTREIAQVRGEFQQLEIAFETMLKNKALSDQLMAEVVDFAAKTPFDLKGVASGAKQLLAYGTQAEDIIDTMRRLGDVAAGLSIPFNDLVYLYGTSAVQGRVMTKDLMQFANRGIPVIEELSKSLNVSKSEILDLTSKGQIHFEHLQQVIHNLTEETGMFGGMMEKQSKSITGLISNLGDAWDRMLNSIGESNQDTFSGAITTATSVVENYERVLDILKVIVATYGTYRAAIILNSIAINGYSKVLGLAVIKQNLLNVAQKASPWGLVLSGITAVVAGLWAYNRAMDDSADKTKEFNEKSNSAVAQSNILFDRLKKTTAGTAERLELIRKLESEHGDYISNLNLEVAALEDIEKAQKAVNDQIIQRLALQEADREKEIWYKKELEIIKQIIEAGYDFNQIMEERANPTFNESGRRVLVSYGNEIDSLLANYEAIQREKTSIDDLYQKIVKGLRSNISGKSPGSLKSGLEEDKKTFAQKLKEIQQLYENYYRWTERYGKEAADKQFSNLITGGQSYLEYLNREIAKLENKQNISISERDNLSNLLASKDDLIGTLSRIELFNEEIQNARDGYKDLIDYISFIKSKLVEVGEFDGTELSFSKIKLLTEELSKSEKEFTKQSMEVYEDLLRRTADFAAKRLAIEKEYQDNVRKLDKNSLSTEDYEKALVAAQKLRDEQLQGINALEIASSEAYDQLTNNLSRLTRNEAQRFLEILRKQLAVLELQPEEYEKILKLIEDVEAGLATTRIENMADGLNFAADQMQRIAGMFSSVNENIDHSVRSLADAVGYLSNALRGLKIDPATGGFADSFGAAGSITGMIFSTADALDKMFGFQARIKKVEEERVRYNQMLLVTLEDITSELEKQLNTLSKGVNYNQSAEFIKDTIDQLRAQINKMKFELQGLPDNLDKYVDPVGIDALKKLTGMADTFEALRKAFKDGIISQEQYNIAMEYFQAIEDAEERLIQLREEQNRLITGTTVSELADTIVSMFEAGKRSAQDFADTFEDIMKKAILQGLKMKILEPQLERWLKGFVFGLENNGLDNPDFIVKMREGLREVFENAGLAVDAIEEIIGPLFDLGGNVTSLTGAIRGVSEETAGIIAGQMNAIRMNQAQSLSIMNNQLLELSKIEWNTRNNVYIRNIYEFLQLKSNDPINQSRATGG